MKGRASALIISGLLFGASLDAKATLSWQNPLTIETKGIVGAAFGVTGQGQGGSEYVMGVAQDLLNMKGGVRDPVDMTKPFKYWTSTTDYNGIIYPDTAQAKTGSGVYVASGYDFVIAKYDGKNAGYILFYLGGEAANLPQYPYDFWTENQTQYALSGFTAFKATGISMIPVPEPTTMIAGALLLLPFGASTLRVLRKKHAA